jgi:hypothetical protein
MNHWQTYETATFALDDPVLYCYKRILYFLHTFYVQILFIYLAGCTMSSHHPAPIWQLYYLLPPVTSAISVFFHQSLFSHQSFNPFRPGKFRSTSFCSSQWTPFHNFFWQIFLLPFFELRILMYLKYLSTFLHALYTTRIKVTPWRWSR